LIRVAGCEITASLGEAGVWDFKNNNSNNGQLISLTASLSALKLPARGDEFRDRRRQRDGNFPRDDQRGESRHAPARRPHDHHDLPKTRREPFCAPVLEPEMSGFIRADRYASKYVPLDWRTVNQDEEQARRIAWGLKAGEEAAIQAAAPGMAALIDGPCWLVPVPASDGSLGANLKLAVAIADLVPGARVKCALARVHPVESSCDRRLDGHIGLTIAQHAIIRTAGPMQALPVYFVDNVITTGTTIAASRRALGWGTGLAYADGSTWRNTRSRP
jgi:hypothetical protein